MRQLLQKLGLVNDLPSPGSEAVTEIRFVFKCAEETTINNPAYVERKDESILVQKKPGVNTYFMKHRLDLVEMKFQDGGR
jgi:hypothetical protein